MACKLDYMSFMTELQENISGYFKGQADVMIRKVVKNNSFEFDCLVIFGNHSFVSPNFYIQRYYRRYLSGEGMDDIVNDILCEYEKSQDGRGKIDLSFDKIQDRIVFRLVSFDRNKKLLNTVPHIRFLDLAITFHCLMMQTDESIGSIRITNMMAKEWDISRDKLYQMAKTNTGKLFPKRICTLSQIMDEISEIAHEEQFFDEEKEIMDAMREGTLDMPYVLTNSNGINGAAAMLYPDCLKEIGVMLKGDFFILPSSIHEVLILPAKAQLCEGDLEQMVQDVNESYVMPDEMLSDHVYRYYASTGTVEICNGYEMAS